MSPEMLKFFTDRDIHMTRDIQRLIPGIMKELYEWGDCDTWDLTKGCDLRHYNALRAVSAAGLADDKGRHAYVTDEGMAFVERFKLSEYAP